jgi:glucosylceramidase
MKYFCYLIVGLSMVSCKNPKPLSIQIFETSAAGNQLAEVKPLSASQNPIIISLDPELKFQKITGFGGSFTEASASLLNKISAANRKKILEAYFGDSGARYSLTRTHMGSCDFSLNNYTYAPVENDRELAHFSIREDMDDIVPMIREAMSLSSEGFRIIATPWTAPPWMKDNKDWRGGRLLPEYYPTWAEYFSKYLEAYRKSGIQIWGVTVENEPLGNDSNWESMHFTPREINHFVTNHLGPKMRSSHPDVRILGYDQNRGEEFIQWIDAMYDDPHAKNYYDGTAIHWYASTWDYFPDALQYAHHKAPDKYLIQTEACIDAQVPVWQDDKWYWSKEATDWGWDWAPEHKKHLHPKYIPAHRYARDIIGCLNNWVDGWVDWNMVLDRQGGPNWAKNWCVAPVIVDPASDEVYFTPLYYILSHFSRYIRPDAVRMGCINTHEEIMSTALINKDGSYVVLVFNPTPVRENIQIQIKGQKFDISLDRDALQTIILKP